LISWALPLGLKPSVDALGNLFLRLEGADRAGLTDPRGYNIRWLELLNEVKPALDRFATVL